MDQFNFQDLTIQSTLEILPFNINKNILDYEEDATLITMYNGSRNKYQTEYIYYLDFGTKSQTQTLDLVNFHYQKYIT